MGPLVCEGGVKWGVGWGFAGCEGWGSAGCEGGVPWGPMGCEGGGPTGCVTAVQAWGPTTVLGGDPAVAREGSLGEGRQ